MRLFLTLFALPFCLAMIGLVASYGAQTPASKALTNADVVGMLSAGLSQEVVIAKIKTSASEFDTSPGTLALLKAAKVPDSVILAMIQVPISESHPAASSALAMPEEMTIPETSTSGRINCSQSDPVPVFPAPPRIGVVEAFSVKCGDTITILGPIDKQSWLKMRAADGQVGYISRPMISVQKTTEPKSKTLENKRMQIQKVNDDLDDCKSRAQSEYETKLNVVGTMTLTPVQRVYASSKLKQNLDVRLKSCRSEYESRRTAIERE
jgi:hypothetical protein